MRNEEECVCSVALFRCNIFVGFKINKEMPGLVGSGTPYSRAIPLLPLWAVQPVQSLSACTRVHFTFFFYLLEFF